MNKLLTFCPCCSRSRKVQEESESDDVDAVDEHALMHKLCISRLSTVSDSNKEQFSKYISKSSDSKNDLETDVYKDVMLLLYEMCNLVELRCEGPYTYIANVDFGPQQEETVSWLPKDILSMQFLRKGKFYKIYYLTHLNSSNRAVMKVVKSRENHVISTTCWRQESEIWITLTGHPHVAQLIALFSSETVHCVVMEYIHGSSLGSMIRRNGTIPASLAKLFLYQLCCVTVFMHKRGIFHRNINSTNVMITTDGVLKIRDFQNSTKQSHSRGIHGAWYYTAPEVFLGKRYDCRADWYSVGVCLYEMLFGITPMQFFCRLNKIKFVSLDFSGRLVVSLTMKVGFPDVMHKDTLNILKNFLQKDPEKRLGSSDDIKQFKEHPFFHPTS